MRGNHLPLWGLLCLLLLTSSHAESLQTLVDAVRGPSIGGQWFFALVNEDHRDTTTFNEFRLKRGYLTFNKHLSDRFSVRVTQDIAVDKEGDGRGNIEIRLKYGYLRARLNDFGPFTKPLVEGGMVHRPWLDLEQKINRYRVQGKMFLERMDMVSSADYGITFMSQLGGTLDKETQARIGSHYPGRYGSLAFGIYNGGGYDAIEENQDKLFEARLSLRPLPDQLPGLQLHGVTSQGKGNTLQQPDFQLNMLTLSYEAPFLHAVGTWFDGTGDLAGDALDGQGNSLAREGWSLFGELSIPVLNQVSLFGRYDRMDEEATPDWARRISILGLSWDLREDTLLLLDWQKDEVAGKHREIITELAVEFRF